MSADTAARGRGWTGFPVPNDDEIREAALEGADFTRAAVMNWMAGALWLREQVRTELAKARSEAER